MTRGDRGFEGEAQGMCGCRIKVQWRRKPAIRPREVASTAMQASGKWAHLGKSGWPSASIRKHALVSIRS